jgi:large subunit ribosomal protein L3
MGAQRVTVKNLEVVRVDVEQNLLLVKGAVPGGKGALLSISVNS